MSTRANIIIKDANGDELIYYRHSDGYPDGAMPTLRKFMRRVKEGKIRDNVGQAAGHLIVLGHEEYKSQGLLKDGFSTWKVGAIEPTTRLHSDIEYLYVLDLDKKTITHTKTDHDAAYNATVPAEFYSGTFATA